MVFFDSMHAKCASNGSKTAREIDGELLEYGVKSAQQENGLQENRKLQISMSGYSGPIQ